jgi:hypothetical protein
MFIKAPQGLSFTGDALRSRVAILVFMSMFNSQYHCHNSICKDHWSLDTTFMGAASS